MAHDWQASFISAATPSGPEDSAVYFRRDFEVTDALRSATLKVTALGIVVTYLNGVRVGEDVLSPGWTSYRHNVDVRSYDVTDLVTSGANAIGAVVGEGWAVGSLTWDHLRHRYSDRPALFAQLHLEYDDHTDIIGTDTLFRVGAGGVRVNGIYDGEAYDARLEPTGWSEHGFDDSTWEQAETLEWDLDALQTPIAPPIRRIQEIEPVAISTSPSGKTIVDFGQVIAGWVRITVSGESGRSITLRHGEILTPTGELETETNRGAKATDHYTLRGNGTETWEPGFTFHGFRFVEVDGWPGVLDASDIRAIVVHSDMERTGWFETSNDLVTQLHRNIVWSMRGNFVGVPTDCPQRDERLGWAGDLNAFSPTAAYLYDVRGVLDSWLRDLRAEQRVEGTVPWVVPDVVQTPSSAAALWSDVAVSLPWTLYQEYGDLEILRTSYDSMTSFIREVEGKLDENGLWGTGFQFGDWLDPDAPADRPFDGKADRYLIACAFLCKTTREMTETAELLGHDEDASQFGALHQRVLAAFRHEFVAPSGRLVSEAVTSYSLAIMFDTLDPEQKARAGDRLAEMVEEEGFRIATGFAGTPLVTDALTTTGHLKEAYKLLLQTESPSFLYPVTMGATTMWERWDAVLPDGRVNATGMTSLNHYALGAVADWLHRVVGGLQRLEPGWRRILVAPQPGGALTSARAAHDTPAGRAEVDWHVNGAEVILKVLIPQGTTASVVLPLHPQGETAEVGEGTHEWRYEIPAGYGAVRELTMDTPMKEVMEDQAIWSAIVRVFATYYPAMPFGAAGSHMGSLSLNEVLERVPNVSEEVAQDLHKALAAGQGDR